MIYSLMYSAAQNFFINLFSIIVAVLVVGFIIWHFIRPSIEYRRGQKEKREQIEREILEIELLEKIARKNNNSDSSAEN